MTRLRVRFMIRSPALQRVAYRGFVYALTFLVTFNGSLPAAGTDGWTTVADIGDFAQDTAGWTESNWSRMGARYDTANEARIDADGALQLYPLPYKGQKSYGGRHGNVVTRPLNLYGDFDVTCLVQWDRKAKYAVVETWLALIAGESGGANPEAVIELKGDAFNVWPGKTVAAGGVSPLPLAGEGTARFLRRAGMLKIYWNETQVAEREWDVPVQELRLTLRTYTDRQAPGSFVGLKRLRVLADGSGLPVLDKPAAEAESLLPGGDFREKVEETGANPDAALMNKERQRPGAGKLKGWATPVDGRSSVWTSRGKDTNERALRLEIGGKPEGVSFQSEVFHLAPGKSYILSGLACLTGKVFADLKMTSVDASHRQTPAAQWRDTTTGQEDRKYATRRVMGNWSPLAASFAAKTNGNFRLTLSVTPASAIAPSGSAAFGKLVIREATPRDSLRGELESLLHRTMSVRGEARIAEYESDVVLDISGFDIEEAPASEDKRKAAARREAFRTWIAGEARTAARAAADAVRRSGAALTFSDRLPSAEIKAAAAKLNAAIGAWQASAAEWKKRREALGLEAATLRPARRSPLPSNDEWLRKRFHLIWFNHYGTMPPGEAEAIRYMGKMGSTGYLNLQFRREDWQTYAGRTRRELDLLGRESIKLLCEGAASLVPHPEQMKEAPENLKKYLEAFGDHPAFAGFQFDEIHCGDCPCAACAAHFRSWVRDHFTAKELAGLGIIKRDIAELAERPAPTVASRKENIALHMIGLEARADIFVESVKKAYETAHAIKPDIVVFNLLSPAQVMGGPFDAPVWKLAPMSDMLALDPYWNGVPEEAYFMDLIDARMRGPAILTIGTHYGGITPATFARDLAISFAHSQGVYVFDWPFAFKQPPYLKPGWAGLWYPEGKWDVMEAYAKKARKLEPYLLNAESDSPVALLHSDRSSAADFYKTSVMNLEAGPYTLGQMGLYCLLQQAHLQADPHYIEGLDIKTLSRYRVAILHNAISLTPEEEELLRGWVRNGGRLIATASSSIRDRWGRERKNYGLSDVFGVRYMGTTNLPEGAVFDAGGAVAYSGRYDRIEPAGGLVTARFTNGLPAVVENAFGKGGCVFIAAQDLGRSYTAEKRGGEIRDYFAVHKKFNKGIREFMAGTIRQAVAKGGTELPFEARHCPDSVEVVWRVQKREGESPRRILHLMNYGLDEPVSGVEIALPAPASEEVSAFYPIDRTAVKAEIIKAARGENRLILRVRDFGIHECIVAGKQ